MMNDYGTTPQGGVYCRRFLFCFKKEVIMAEKYIYNGPVMKFNTCIQSRWSAETYAVSPTKARSNLVYRYKKENGFANTAKITLPGELKLAS